MGKRKIEQSEKSLITSRPISQLSKEQLDKFTKESIRARVVNRFDPEAAINILKKCEGKKVIAIDIGGYKIESATFKVKNGSLEEDKTKSHSFHSSQGQGYLDFIEKIASECSLTKSSIGISYAGPIEGTKPIEGPNIPKLLTELKTKYKGDFAKLFPTLKAMTNDAVAGLIAGSLYAKMEMPNSRNVILIINGSGIGGSILKDGQIFEAEPGHVDVIPKLNPYGQTDPCQLTGNICIHNVGGGKSGIESIWNKKTKDNSSSKDISTRMIQGNKFAQELYDNSALLVAHTIAGIGRATEMLNNPEDTTIIFHGGVFKVPGYTERVLQILQKYLGFEPQFLVTSDFTPNACLEGAAITALTI